VDAAGRRLGAGGEQDGATRLGFGLMLKFFEQEGRFPRHVGELPKAAVDYVAGQVKVEPALLAEYDWSGRSIERHRAACSRSCSGKGPFVRSVLAPVKGSGPELDRGSRCSAAGSGGGVRRGRPRRWLLGARFLHAHDGTGTSVASRPGRLAARALGRAAPAHLTREGR
jgi:hypothetical protein